LGHVLLSTHDGNHGSSPLRNDIPSPLVVSTFQSHDGCDGFGIILAAETRLSDDLVGRALDLCGWSAVTAQTVSVRSACAQPPKAIVVASASVMRASAAVVIFRGLFPPMDSLELPVDRGVSE
jgi:hypothetical protein